MLARFKYYIYISPGSLAPHLRFADIFTDHFAAVFLQRVSVKKLGKSTAQFCQVIVIGCILFHSWCILLQSDVAAIRGIKRRL